MRLWTLSLGHVDAYDDKRSVSQTAMHNWEALMGARCGHFNSWKASMPPADVTMNFDGPSPDYFHIEGIIFISKKLRDLFGEPDSAVEYFDVLPDKLSPDARDMDYKCLHILAGENAIDIEQSKFEMKTYGSPHSHPSFTQIVIRKNLVPKTQLFRDKFGLGYEFCTDALALRVLKSDCQGLDFREPESLTHGNQSRWRTLRGIEMDVWDPELDDFVTTVVEEIPTMQ